MIGLLKLGATLPRLRHCEALVTGGRWIKQMSGTARSHVSKTSDIKGSQFLAQDKIPAGFRFVYHGTLNNYVQLAHHTSTCVTFMALTMIYIFFFVDPNSLEFPTKTPVAPIGLKNYIQVSIMYAFLFGVMYCLRLISTKYVLRMYYNPTTETYRAVKMGLLPTTTRQQDFQACSFIRQTKKSILPWKNGVYNANGNQFMIFGSGFKVGIDFNRMFKDYK